MTWKNRLELRLQQRRDQQLWRKRTRTSSPQSPSICVDGKSLLNFCSNDYLGLANHPQLIAAGLAALKKWGAGSGASHLICGHSELHEQLETAIAQFVNAERALVFSTGYMANLSIPQAFLDRHDLLLEDKLNHASLLDAGQLGPAKMTRYAHRDHRAAEQLLQQSTAPFKMLFTDGVFSMDGDVAPVAELNQICTRQETLLVVDDAHGFGVLGPHGGGCLQQYQIPIAGHVLLVGTFGKAAGSFGAFVAGDQLWIESLIQFARPYIYTTALPPAVIATTLAAIEIMQQEPQRRTRLLENVRLFRQLALSAGLQLSDSETPIQPVFVRRSTALDDAATQTRLTVRLSQQLLDSGIWVAAIRPPTVPPGLARLRVTLSSEHTAHQIARLVAALSEGLA